MRCEITPLSDHMAAEVVGFDFRENADEVREEINSALVQHHVLVMRDQRFEPEQFRTAAQLFGELFDMPEAPVLPDHPGLTFLCNKTKIEGKPTIYGGIYHIDHSFKAEPPKASTLFAVELPSVGGDTQFANLHRAYDELPAGGKAFVDRLNVVHGSLMRVPNRAYSIHPLVSRHPENHKLMLYLNPARMEGVVGLPHGVALLNHLINHAMQPQFEYRHKWRVGDWMIWDNRSLMHKANFDYDMNERRFLYRVMLKGGRVLH